MVHSVCITTLLELIYTSMQEQQNLTLLFSSFEGKMTTLYRYLKEGVNFDFPDYDGRTAIHLAVCGGRII